MRTAYARVEAPNHAYPGHPENPRRFDSLKVRLETIGAQRLEPAPATEAEMSRVHQPGMIASLKAACAQGASIIDMAPTYVTSSSFAEALLAAGAAVDCTRAVLDGQADDAFAIVRPPGHHAEPDHAMGFCLFNNVAIATREALQHDLKRIAIVDFDAHHGNGTQAAFLFEERVAYLSTHQWGIYPGTGWFQEAEHARKRIVNVPLPAGSGDLVYRRVADEIVEPFIRAFRPQLMLISAGYDAHWNDPITDLGISTAGFYRLSRKLVDLAEETANGKIVFVLEGGYDPINLAEGVVAGFAALMGTRFVDPRDACPMQEPDASGRLAEIKAWHGF